MTSAVSSLPEAVAGPADFFPRIVGSHFRRLGIPFALQPNLCAEQEEENIYPFLLPHGGQYRFLARTQVDSHSRTAVCMGTISPQLCDGHFPSPRPVVIPGVLLVEFLAHSLGALIALAKLSWLRQCPTDEWEVMLGSILNCDALRPAYPGQPLTCYMKWQTDEEERKKQVGTGIITQNNKVVSIGTVAGYLLINRQPQEIPN